MRIHHATATKAKKFGIILTVEDNEVVATKAGVRLAAGLQGNKVLEDAITKATGKPAKGGTPAARIGKTPAVVTPEEEACREAGWTKKRGGGFKNAETEDDSDAADWAALAEEQELIETEELVDPEDDEDDSDAEQGKSIVKSKYKERYKPTKDKCGDDLSFKINEFVTVEDEETGEKKVSKKLLRAFAEANEAWTSRYGNFINRVGTWNSGMALMCVNNRIRAKVRQAKKADGEYKIVWPKV